MKTVTALILAVICMTGCTWKDGASVAAGSLAAVAVAAAGGDPMDVGVMDAAVGESVTAATSAALEDEEGN